MMSHHPPLAPSSPLLHRHTEVHAPSVQFPVQVFLEEKKINTFTEQQPVTFGVFWFGVLGDL